jgi:hypothetical protein
MGGEKRAPVDPVTAAEYVRRFKCLIEAEHKSKGLPFDSAAFDNAPPPLVIHIHGFTEADWKEIKESLTERGVDLDTQMVGEFVPGQRWWLPNDSTVRLPLRDELEHMAWHYQYHFIPDQERTTPVQDAGYLQKTLKVFENALYHIDRTAIDRQEAKDYSDDDFWADSALCDRIQKYINRQQERIDRLRAMPSPRVANARTVHNDYWRELTRLWWGITGSAGPVRRKSLHRFLLVCSRSIFPEFTTRELDQKIKGFISNLSRKKRPRAQVPRRVNKA